MMAPNARLNKKYVFVEKLTLKLSDFTEISIEGATGCWGPSFSTDFPITVEKCVYQYGDPSKYDVLDGFHRLRDFINAGVTEIEVEVYYKPA